MDVMDGWAGWLDGWIGWMDVMGGRDGRVTRYDKLI